MLKKRSVQVVIALIVIILGTYLLYTSFESRFNKVPKDMQLTIFKNTKHFNISVFGDALSERDVKWVMWVVEKYYTRVYQWYGDHSGKEWMTIYIANDFPEYYKSNGEMILIPSDKVKNRDLKFILIKVAHLMTGSYKWPWYKAHVASEGLAAYLANKYLGRTFRYKSKLEGKANLAKLDGAKYFCWKMSAEQQGYVYDKAGGFIAYLVRKYGIKQVKELYKLQGEGWDKVYGHSLADLEKQWIARY